MAAAEPADNITVPRGPAPGSAPGSDKIDRLITVLEEIRDRLPKPAPATRDAAWMLFGYRQGQERPPTEFEVAMAHQFLGGKLTDPWAMMPTAAFDIAREIIERGTSKRPDSAAFLREPVCYCDPPPAATYGPLDSMYGRCTRCGRRRGADGPT